MPNTNTEIMKPLPFDTLIDWVLKEYAAHGSVFNIRANKFFKASETANNSKNEGGSRFFELFLSKICTPIGPAAGPHTQLAQNILCAFLAGARFIELKTVQTMDGEELRKCIARPCINAEDEGYNVEWSTELTVEQALEEYVKAWFLCHIFAKEYQLEPNLIFNMSVGYSLEGIKSEKIDLFIEGLKDAGKTRIWKQCVDTVNAKIDSFGRFVKEDIEAISPEVSNNITLSTLHGCPRDEIERIAVYLITEKKLHTFVKCNPTLLGFQETRKLLDSLGYSYVSFDEHHFKNDLQFSDAVQMFTRLKEIAKERGLVFGVKLTNTFPVEIKKSELPGAEMYMSGRSLFPLSLNVARKISLAFDGELPISYSGGADFFNLEDVLKTGIKPVTVATTLLKPGGYERLGQLAAIAEKAQQAVPLCEHECNRIDPAAGDNTVIEKSGLIPRNSASQRIIDLKALDALCESIYGRGRLRKEYRQAASRKTESPLPLFDCFKAPCADGGCPIHQNIPGYLSALAAGQADKAFEIIARDNSAPSITGTICDHKCQGKCNRVDYDDSLRIREAKLYAAEYAQYFFTKNLEKPEIKTRVSAGIIGAGPAGIAAAVFLRRNGVPVTVYEKRDKPFGIVHYVIPSFRIPYTAILRDFRMAEKLGIEFVFNAPENYSISGLKKEHDFIVIATGAWKEGSPVVKNGQEKIYDALRFLEDSKKTECSLNLGKRVAVIGGGDVAMDCARAAKRNKDVESVTVVYRRTREFMPSMYEEQQLALEDGVEFKELLAPESYTGGKFVCEKMRLGEYDASGRRSVEETGEKAELFFDTVIGATGAAVDAEDFTRNGIALDKKGLPETNANGECSIPGVYVAGDCRSGAATVVKAIAGAKTVALDILGRLGLGADFTAGSETVSEYGNCGSAGNADCGPYGEQADFSKLCQKKGILSEAKPVPEDGNRCLSCDILCEICVDVCPNRANVPVEVDFYNVGGLSQPRQIVHVDRLCNECGNCAVFCPHSGKPYRDKFTVFCDVESFNNSENAGYVRTGETYRIRLEDKTEMQYGGKIPAPVMAVIRTVAGKYGYLEK